MTSYVKYSLHSVTDTLWDVSDQGLPYSNIFCIKFQNSLVWLLSVLRRLFLEDPDETDFFSIFALCSPQLDFYSVILLGKPGMFTHSFPLFASFLHLLGEARCYKWKNHRFDIARKFIHWTMWQTICGKSKKFTDFCLVCWRLHYHLKYPWLQQCPFWFWVHCKLLQLNNEQKILDGKKRGKVLL